MSLVKKINQKILLKEEKDWGQRICLKKNLIIANLVQNLLKARTSFMTMKGRKNTKKDCKPFQSKVPHVKKLKWKLKQLQKMICIKDVYFAISEAIRSKKSWNIQKKSIPFFS